MHKNKSKKGFLHRVGNKVKGLDQFGEGFHMRLENGN